MRFGRTTNAIFMGGVLLATGLSSPDAFAQGKGPKPAPAAAPPVNDDKSKAADLFKKGADAYMKGDFNEAIKLLDQAYALDPQPVMVYNKARAEEGLGKTDDAITLYEQYLTQEPNSPDRGAIEQRLSTLKKQRDEKAALEAANAQAEKDRQERERNKPKPHKRSPLPYVVAGVGGAGIVTGIIFGVLAKGKESDGNSAKIQTQAIDARDSGSTLATVANISFIAGGVLIAAGAVWWALDRLSKTQTASNLPLWLIGQF